jgi:hypothetical protein
VSLRFDTFDEPWQVDRRVELGVEPCIHRTAPIRRRVDGGVGVDRSTVARAGRIGERRRVEATARSGSSSDAVPQRDRSNSNTAERTTFVDIVPPFRSDTR